MLCSGQRLRQDKRRGSRVISLGCAENGIRGSRHGKNNRFFRLGTCRRNCFDWNGRLCGNYRRRSLGIDASDQFFGLYGLPILLEQLDQHAGSRRGEGGGDRCREQLDARRLIAIEFGHARTIRGGAAGADTIGRDDAPR